MSQHSCPWPELPSDAGHRGASDPSVPNSAPSLFPVSVGETAAEGERMGVGRSREREGGAENQSCVFLSSATSSFLCKVRGGGLSGPAENPAMPNFKPLPFADPRTKCWILSALPRLETKERSSAQSHSAVPKSLSSPYFPGSDLQFPGHREASQPILELTSFSKLKSHKSSCIKLLRVF